MKAIGIPEIVFKHIDFVQFDEGASPEEPKYKHQILIDRDFNVWVIPWSLVTKTDVKSQLGVNIPKASDPIHMGGVQFLKIKTNARLTRWQFARSDNVIFANYPIEKLKLSRALKSKNIYYIFSIDSYSILEGGKKLEDEIHKAAHDKIRSIAFNVRSRSYANITVALPTQGIKAILKTGKVTADDLSDVYGKEIHNFYGMFSKLRENFFQLPQHTLDMNINAQTYNSSYLGYSSALDVERVKQETRFIIRSI